MTQGNAAMDEPTAWQDINPVTASAPQRGQLSPYSERLQPASNDQFRDELTACLALVVPVGMTEESRREWLAVAWGTLKHLPPDLLSIGCKAAREQCDHPSKIVPTILRETEQAMRWRKDAVRDASSDAPRLTAPEVCTPAQAAEILREF